MNSPPHSWPITLLFPSHPSPGSRDQEVDLLPRLFSKEGGERPWNPFFSVLSTVLSNGPFEADNVQSHQVKRPYPFFQEKFFGSRKFPPFFFLFHVVIDQIFLKHSEQAWPYLPIFE